MASRRQIRCDDWFSRIVGCREIEWRQQTNKLISQHSDGSLFITNCTNQKKKFNAGRFSVLRLEDLRREVETSSPSKPALCPLEIITCLDGSSTRNVDVAHLQAMPENRNAVFQVASNFNGVEAISESIPPDRSSFTENYIYDHTQGPAASISAGPGAITRVHAAFYDPNKPQSDWDQTSSRQVNFLEDLNEHFPITNGYVVLNGEEPTFPNVGSDTYAKLFDQVKIGYHHNTQVTTGHREGEYLEAIKDPEQLVDQVFCAAMNVGQGESGIRNSTGPGSVQKMRFILDSGYAATYLSAIKHKRKHLVLTLIGGGVFGNPKIDIYKAIVEAHKNWASHQASTLERVSLVLFSGRDFEQDRLFAELRNAKIPFRWIDYTQGSGVTKHQYGFD